MSSDGLNNTVIEKLRDDLAGEVIVPPDPAYREACSIFNAMIDRRPALIAQCENADDCLLYTSPSPRDGLLSRMPSSA